MVERVIQGSKGIKGDITVAPDKSISHRAVIFSSLARGECVVKNYLHAEDTLTTVKCMMNMGVSIRKTGSDLIVSGCGLRGLKEPDRVLECNNSGTTMRLLAGLLAGQNFFAVLNGDSSLNRRPMNRVIAPLKLMGADIRGRREGNNPPLAISGQRLKGITYHLPIASAQVKSAIILAALNAEGVSIIVEPQKSRDHSENMLLAMGATIQVEGRQIIIHPSQELSPQEFTIPGDISAAAFFLVAAAIVPGSELRISNVGVNPTRAGILEILQKMGARIKLEQQRVLGGEAIADIIISSSSLKAVNIEGEIIPRLIDELPILAVAMAAATGESVVRGAGELRVKETDRIQAICSELSKMGIMIDELEDGFIVKGKDRPFQGARVDSHGDHRIAMSLAIAGLLAEGETIIDNAEVVNISFPDFWKILDYISEN